MKFPLLLSAALCLGLAACASPNEGNPNGAAYVGSPGSTYDAGANPPRTNGVVSYDPRAPLAPDAAAMTPGGSPATPAPMPR
jgi:hypothetical protein